MSSSWNSQYDDLMKLSTDSLYDSYEEIVTQNKRLESENILLRDKVQNLNQSRADFLKNARECMESLERCKERKKDYKILLERAERSLTRISKEKAELWKSYSRLHGVPLNLVRKEL